MPLYTYFTAPSCWLRKPHNFAGLAQIAHRAGVPVILDAGGTDGDVSEDLLQYVTVISPNESELARMTGMPTSTVDDAMAAGESLLSRGVEAVLLKLGAHGSVMLRSAGFPFCLHL